MYRIEIPTDHLEASEFVAWLRLIGHDAVVGGSTSCFINGMATGTNEQLNTIMTQLWDDYCGIVGE